MRYFSLGLALLALLVIALGAYTRLSDAGLGCPDWPGCYGQVAVPSSPEAIAQIEVAYEQALEPQKAWIEMIHRYVAGTLGLGILVIFGMSWKPAKHNKRIPWLTCVLVGMVIFQALLGMWTVTLKLYPPVILLHLFGGITTLSLLWWHSLQYGLLKPCAISVSFRPWLIFGLLLLIIQIALGGWTSANYAALICPDFPYCQGQLLPHLSWASFFHSSGIASDNQTLVTIHMMHRFGAIIVVSYLLGLSSLMLVKKRLSKSHLFTGLLLGFLILMQATLGILNIVLLLPMFTAVAHNVVAVLMVVTLLTMIYRSQKYSAGKKSDILANN